MTDRVVFVDNRDSFTFNLVDAVRRSGSEVIVLRNGASPQAVLDACGDDGVLLLSPGPGSPRTAGRLLEIVAAARGRVPMLGVCLGHQAIVEEAGGQVVRAPEVVHGKVSSMVHDGTGIFEGLPSPLRVGRYHSLVATAIPERFFVHAYCDGLVMAISDPKAGQVGLQFHPESILTPDGDQLLHHFVGRFIREQ